jgi:hypothetical protein
MNKCFKCSKESIGAVLDYITLKPSKYYCDDHFDDAAYVKVEKEEE